jgi:hypothetical protein
MAVVPYVVVVLVVSDDLVGQRGRSLCDIRIGLGEQPA